MWECRDFLPSTPEGYFHWLSNSEWTVHFFNIWKTCHIFLTSVISDEKDVIIQTLFPIASMWFLSCCFQTVFLSLVFRLTVMHQVLISLNLSNLEFTQLHEPVGLWLSPIGRVFHLYFFDYFLRPILFLLSFWDSVTQILDFLLQSVLQVLKSLFFFFQSIFCYLD